MSTLDAVAQEWAVAYALRRERLVQLQHQAEQAHEEMRLAREQLIARVSAVVNLPPVLVAETVAGHVVIIRGSSTDPHRLSVHLVPPAVQG